MPVRSASWAEAGAADGESSLPAPLAPSAASGSAPVIGPTRLLDDHTRPTGPSEDSDEDDAMPVDDGGAQAGSATVRSPAHTAGWASQVVQFICTSERTGFRHLYLVTYRPGGGTEHMRALTTGDWVVLDQPIYVDTVRMLVYFMAKRDTPLGMTSSWTRRLAAHGARRSGSVADDDVDHVVDRGAWAR